MSAESTTFPIRSINAGKWLTGAGVGAVGAVAASVVLFAMGASDLSTVTVEMLGVLFMPGAVFGLLYTAIASFERIAPLTTKPQTGVVLGLLYGILFWLTTIIGDAFSLGGFLAGVTFGIVIGLLYAVSPYVE